MAMSMKEVMESHFASKSEVAELQKAISTDDASAGALVPIDYDPEILSMIVKKSPWLTRMMSLGQVKPTISTKPSYRKKITGGATSFIAENGDIPSPQDSTWKLTTADMHTIVTPIEIGDMVAKASNTVEDIMAQEITDAMTDQAYTKENQAINGHASNNGYAGLGDLIVTNKEDMGGDPVGKKELRMACETMIDLGGTPTAILTTSQQSSYLEDELYPGLRQVNQTDLVTGIGVTAFRAPNGQDIPIITDMNVPKTDGGAEVFVLDESVLHYRDLMTPTPIPLAKTKLTSDLVIAQFTTFYCRAETWQYRFYNVGIPDPVGV